jgi:hypothetical protein
MMECGADRTALCCEWENAVLAGSVVLFNWCHKLSPGERLVVELIQQQAFRRVTPDPVPGPANFPMLVCHELLDMLLTVNVVNPMLVKRAK